VPYPYTFKAMEADVRRIVRSRNITGWIWDGSPRVRADSIPEVLAHYPNGHIEHLIERNRQWHGNRDASHELFVCLLSVYCFQVYTKALSASGDQVIGREADLQRSGLYRKVADIHRQANGGRAATLFGANAQGNLLLMDKWMTVMNDAWLLGGIHRGANYRLASPRSLQNLWNFDGGYLVVTARELIGLKNWGYELTAQEPHQYYKPKNKTSTAIARRASLRDYDDLIARKGTRMKDIIEFMPNYNALNTMFRARAQRAN
jgi:hypothetical protein